MPCCGGEFPLSIKEMLYSLFLYLLDKLHSKKEIFHILYWDVARSINYSIEHKLFFLL